MAKLVGVVHENEEDSSSSNFSSRCLARRQLPLTIEQGIIFQLNIFNPSRKLIEFISSFN